MSAAAEVKRRNRLEATRRRSAEERDAMHFLTAGTDAHLLSGCIHDEPCSRDYEPAPFLPVKSGAGRVLVTSRQQALPAGESMYEGTAIGALYGLGGEQHLWQLAGWNVRGLTA